MNNSVIVSLRDIVVEFDGQRILDGLNLDIHDKEFVTLLGSSGCGKTTTLRLIAGFLEPTSGKVLLKGEDITGVPPYKRPVNTVFQKYALFPHLNVFENVAFGLRLKKMDEETIRRKVRDMLEVVGLKGFERRSIGQMSGGQQQRVAIARSLVNEPEILLLDEPTNYLDAEHIEWLKRYLNDYENAFILISHDIPFLNSVINLIYHMDNQQLNRYVGDYDKFQEVYAMKKAQMEAAFNRQQKEIADLKDFVARNKARVATRNMAMSRQKKLDNMDIIELAAEKPKPEFYFKQARTPGRYIFTTKDLVIGYDKPLSVPLNISMERGSKIAMVGANGIGKSTLLKSILGIIQPVSGEVELGDYLEIGYFEQESSPDNTNTCLNEIWEEFPSYTQYEVRSALAKCGLTTKHIESQIRVLSGGEQAKVRLCKLINRESNILVLDEPTNHLDVDAKDELKRALMEYKGSILMVCHEPEFYDGLVNEVWDCSKWTTLSV